MEWGRLHTAPVTERQGWFYGIATFVVSFLVNMWALSLIGGMDNAAIWIIYPFTNYVYALWTWRFWRTRAAQVGTRKYNDVALQVVITLSIVTIIIPGMSWYLAVSPFFNQPWFYLGGLGVTAVSCYNLYNCLKLPKGELSASAVPAVAGNPASSGQSTR